MRPLALLVLAAALISCGSRALGPHEAPAVTAAGETDGVRLRLDLDRATIKPGQIVWATVTIENTNDHEITWVGGGCNVPGRVTAIVPTIADYGRSWTEYLFAELKKRLVIGVTSSGWVPFLDEASWAQRAGGRACTADIRPIQMAPRAKLVTRFVWDGMLRPGDPAPSGRLDITAALDMDDRILMVGKSVSATAPLDLTGGAATRVSPARAVDAALEEGRFAAWVRSHARPDSYGQQTAYDVEGAVQADGDVWVIKAFKKPSASAASEIEVRVDARDATIRSVAIR